MDISRFRQRSPSLLAGRRNIEQKDVEQHDGLFLKHFSRVFIIVTLAVLSVACDTTLGTKSFTDPLPQFTVPGAPLPSELGLSLTLGLPNPAIDLGAGSSFVTFVTLRNLTLSILDSSDVDSNDDGAQDSFDFLTGLNIRIRADFNGKTNELLVATLPDGDPQFASAARELTLTIVNGNIDVLDFLEASGGYEVILDLNGTIPPDNIILSGTIRYRVGLGLDL